MQAFITGQMKIQADMRKLMAFQGVKPTGFQEVLTQKVRGITDKLCGRY